MTNFLGIESIWFIRLKISCQNEVILFLISLLVILAGLFGSIRNNAYLPKYQEKVIFFLLSVYWVQNDIHRWWTPVCEKGPYQVSGRGWEWLPFIFSIEGLCLWRHPPAFSGSGEATEGCNSHWFLSINKPSFCEVAPSSVCLCILRKIKTWSRSG